MKIGIAGLGLIGGSLAKAYKLDNHTVLGYDINSDTLSYALLSKTIDAVLDKENIKSCDVILIALTPKAVISFLAENADAIGENQLVIDCCGIKKCVCEAGFALAEKHKFLFIGGHPMAGTQYSGIKNSRADMFKGATMALVPPVFDDMAMLERAKEALLPIGFGRYTVWTAEKHDEIIAFTSQMAHIVSNAYMKSPTAKEHKGLSAGSYKDLTRVAYLNAPMWTELFMDNKEHVLFELNTIIRSLNEYKEALETGNSAELERLLAEGSALKQEVDKFGKNSR